MKIMGMKFASSIDRGKVHEKNQKVKKGELDERAPAIRELSLKFLRSLVKGPSVKQI